MSYSNARGVFYWSTGPIKRSNLAFLLMVRVLRGPQRGVVSINCCRLRQIIMSLVLKNGSRLIS